jgi:hypothetical protein
VFENLKNSGKFKSCQIAKKNILKSGNRGLIAAGARPTKRDGALGRQSPRQTASVQFFETLLEIILISNLFFFDFDICGINYIKIWN